MIKESLSDLTESIQVIENSRLNFDPIIYDSSSLIIPEVLKDLMDEKSKIVEEDIQMYNNKFGELSEKINEFTAMVSQSIKEMPSSLKNLKNEIMNISEVFEETIKEICYPLVLQQQISKNKKISGRKLIKSEEIEEYKLQISELNQLYNKFFQHIKKISQLISEIVKGVPDSVVTLNNYINEGINNYRKMLSELNANNLHENLVSIKDSFLKIKEDMEQKKINMEIRISTFEILINNNKNDFIEFQKNYDVTYNKLEERANDIIKKFSKIIK